MARLKARPSETVLDLRRTAGECTQERIPEIVRVLHAALEREGANVVAVVERHGAHFLQPQHAFCVASHRVKRTLLIVFGSLFRNSIAASNVMLFGTYPFNGSCAEV